MKQQLRSSVVPLYLLLCLVLGGSAQGIWANAVVQLLAVAIIAWSLLVQRNGPLTAAAKGLLVFVVLTLLLFGIQLVPLPPSVWTALPGRQFVAEGFALLGQPPPWLPIALAPFETMATALTLLPPIAVLLGMLLAGAYRPSWLVMAILVGTLAGVLVGALQVGSADAVSSPWYFYERANFGVATGFFANSNHMASLLVISVPLLFALIEDLRERVERPKARSAILLLPIAGALVLLVGIVLNGSLAVLLLGPPVVALSAAMLLPLQMNLRRPLAGLALLGALAMVAIYVTPLHDRLASDNATSINERQTMWLKTVSAIPDYLPFGSGISSFRDLYPRFEDPLEVTLTFTPHAHSDYLELALETGFPGLLLLTAFLIWWGMRTRSIWRDRQPDRYAQAATVATGALLLHGLVDYPLRTAALSAVMAAGLALMVQSANRRNGPADLWRTRHLTI